MAKTLGGGGGGCLFVSILIHDRLFALTEFGLVP